MATMATVNENVRYEPDEHPPPVVTLGAGAQAALITLAPIVLTVVIVVRIADETDSYMSWAAFAALAVSGITTVLQAVRVGPVGSGHILMMGTSGAFIAVCVAALVEGGASTMASLVVISSLFQFLLAARLSLLRRIFTPVVSGTVIMLIAATVMPIVFDTMRQVPEGVSESAGLLAAVVTLVVVTGLVLRGPPAWRLWSPVIGIVAGCAVGAPFGLYDIDQVVDAAWVGVPIGSWPGFDLTPGVEFWALLPAFVVVTLVGAIETVGDGVAIQRVSQRRERATDFRVVQGALNADGVGNLLSGILGTLPNTTYSSSVSLAEITGIGARSVGVVIGALFFMLAFFPKFTAVLIAIPGPVAGAYVTVLLGLLFVQGMKIVVQDGLDHRKAAVAGIAFWVGTAFQNRWFYPDLLGDGFLNVLLSNGMTSGAIVAIVMMVFMELTAPRRQRLRVSLDDETLPKLSEFLRAFASGSGWSPAATNRLLLVGEEAATSMLADESASLEADGKRRLVVTARNQGNGAELEFVSAAEGENLEDQLAHLSEPADVPDGREISFRLLRHYASSVRHQKYHGVDIVTVHVESRR